MSEINVVWSAKGKNTYEEIVESLNSRWTHQEVNYFILRTETVIKKIAENPYMFQQYKDNPFLRRAVLHDTVILIYQITADGNTINLITFRGTRQKPWKS